MMLVMMFFTWLIGMAKPMLSMDALPEEEEELYLAFVMPTTSP